MEGINDSLVGVFSYIQEHIVLVTILAVWVLVWKGIALWKAARLYHRWWFVILLFLNTLGIVEIIYIFIVARKAERLVNE